MKSDSTRQDPPTKQIDVVDEISYLNRMAEQLSAIRGTMNRATKQYTIKQELDSDYDVSEFEEVEEYTETKEPKFRAAPNPKHSMTFSRRDIEGLLAAWIKEQGAGRADKVEITFDKSGTISATVTYTPTIDLLKK